MGRLLLPRLIITFYTTQAPNHKRTPGFFQINPLKKLHIIAKRIYLTDVTQPTELEVLHRLDGLL